MSKWNKSKLLRMLLKSMALDGYLISYFDSFLSVKENRE